MILGTCNIWGSGTLYGTRIYTEPCIIYDAYDFGVALYDYDTGQPINGISWELYRRDSLLDPNSLVDETHILVGNGVTPNSVLTISLTDYDLRTLSTDYYLKSWKTNDHNIIGNLRINYLAGEYTSKDDNWPYIRDVLQAQKESIIVGGGSGGGMGGSQVIHTEYKEKPLPIIKVMAMSDEEEDFTDKEIFIINIKDFDNI